MGEQTKRWGWRSSYRKKFSVYKNSPHHIFEPLSWPYGWCSKIGVRFSKFVKKYERLLKILRFRRLANFTLCKQSSIQFLRHCVWWPVHSWSSDVISYWIHSYRSHWDWRTTVDYPSVSTGFCAATCWRFWWLLRWSCSWWSGCWTCWIRSWSGLGHTWGRSQRRARVDSI